MSVKILVGDVFDRLRALPDESVHMVVSSPPYWGLRSYLTEDDPNKRLEIGLEPTLGEHLDVMVRVFREVRRVLRADGTCWVNYGDCYATQPNGRSAADTKAAGNDDRTFRDKPFSTVGAIYPPTSQDPFRRDMGRRGGGRAPALGMLKPKDLCMVANRLAIALQDDGWWVRSEIVWYKRNPMPESVIDRPGTAHEKIWLLSKSERYFYDTDAVRTGLSESSIARLSQDVENQEGSDRANGGQKSNGRMKAVFSDKQRGHSRRHAGFNERWDKMTGEEQRMNGANLKNVWDIPVRGYREAHFATFPPDIPERCIRAGTSEAGVCAMCSKPWVREVAVRHENDTTKSGRPAKGNRTRSIGRENEVMGYAERTRRLSETKGWWPTCTCGAEPIAATVLDPFGGAGTTGLVADRLKRNAIMIELNDKYARLAEDRIRDESPFFVDLVTEYQQNPPTPPETTLKGIAMSVAQKAEALAARIGADAHTLWDEFEQFIEKRLCEKKATETQPTEEITSMEDAPVVSSAEASTASATTEAQTEPSASPGASEDDEDQSTGSKGSDGLQTGIGTHTADNGNAVS